MLSFTGILHVLELGDNQFYRINQYIKIDYKGL